MMTWLPFKDFVLLGTCHSELHIFLSASLLQMSRANGHRHQLAELTRQ